MGDKDEEPDQGARKRGADKDEGARLRGADEDEGARLRGAALGVVALAFGLNMISRGLGETFAVFLLPVTGDLGWSRSAFSAVYAVYMTAHGLAAPLAGAVFDRFGARAAYVPSLALYGSGFLIAAQMSQMWEAVLGLGIMVGAGVAGTGMTIASGMISLRFRARLGLAMGLAYAGLSVGMIVFAPLAQIAVDGLGWRGAYAAMGWAMLGLAVVLGLAIPWRRLSPAPQGPVRGLFVGRAMLGQAAFWGLLGTMFFTSVSTWAVMLQLVAYLTEQGFAPLAAATAYGAVGAMSVFGVVGMGWLTDRFGRRRVVTISYGMTVAGVGLLWAMDLAAAPVLLAAFVPVFGLTMGARGPVVSTLVARLYPGNVGAVFGAVTLGLGLGAATGGFLSGLLHDLTGGYGAVFALAILAALAGLAPYWALRPLATGTWPMKEGRDGPGT